MNLNNCINMDESLLDKPIYRIMPIHRILQCLEDDQLTLVKPKKWDDPFENALLASTFSIDGGENATLSAKDSVYGQCWTMHRETDAMWRIYSANKDGVKIKTTPRKILAALCDSDKNYASVRCFVSKVTYLSKDDLLKKFGEIDLLNTNGSGIAESLLYKRKEFLHEREIRFIYCGPDGECTSDTYSFSINSNVIFESLTFDPRMNPELRKAYRLAFDRKGYSGKVLRSVLYNPPEGLVYKL